jgi:16S rRNA (guanine966-N2)-methyltransferase
MKTARAARPGSVRIIGGRWRGRRLQLPALTDLRPTPDRVRETLFNWLAPVVDGARCLDLYAGSGALGMEALSRGAAYVCFVDSSAAAARSLRVSLDKLGALGAYIAETQAETYLAGVPEPFDIVFLDPPFAINALENLCTLLERGWLKPAARIYLESSRAQSLPALPPGWRLLREKTAGQVRFALAQRD